MSDNKIPTIGNPQIGNAGLVEIYPVDRAGVTFETVVAAIQNVTGLRPGEYMIEKRVRNLYQKVEEGKLQDYFYLQVKDDGNKATAGHMSLHKDNVSFAHKIDFGFVRINEAGTKTSTYKHRNNTDIQFYPNAQDFAAADLKPMKGAWLGAGLKIYSAGESDEIAFRMELDSSLRTPQALPGAEGDLVLFDCCDRGNNVLPIYAFCGGEDIRFEHDWSPSYSTLTNTANDLYGVIRLEEYWVKGIADKWKAAMKDKFASLCPTDGVIAGPYKVK